jgi:hypothetical protein
MTTFNTTGVVNQSITRTGRNEPFQLQVSRGQITGHSVELISGISGSVGTSYTTVWSQNTVYAYLSTASVMKISSSSANDAAAGTGARTILINGLDANYNEISETVTLNGQTAVNTVNSYLRVFHITVLTAGSGDAAAGTIYAGTGVVTAGVPAVVYGVYTANNGSTATIWTVPAGYTAYIVSYASGYGSTTANANGTVALLVRNFGGVFDTISQVKASNGNQGGLTFEYPIAVSEKSDIEMRALSSTAGASVTAEFQVIYVQNEGAL